MHKILALDSIKTELFHGLHDTVSDLGQRLTRLEDCYGGQEKQLKQIVNDLRGLGGKGKVPYPELRRAVEDVSTYLDRPSTPVGAGETLAVLLKKIVPKHFRTRSATPCISRKGQKLGATLWPILNEGLTMKWTRSRTSIRKRNRPLEKRKSLKTRKILLALWAKYTKPGEVRPLPNMKHMETVTAAKKGSAG